jgi:hypothetical protein
LQAICDRLGPGAIWVFAERWWSILPLSLTEHDRAAGYWWELSMRQVETSRTLVFEAPRRARGFFEALVAGKNRYRLTGDGRRFAIFYTKLHDRLLRPLLAADRPPASPQLRKALHQTGWSIKKFVRTARRHRTVRIRAGQLTLTAGRPPTRPPPRRPHQNHLPAGPCALIWPKSGIDPSRVKRRRPRCQATILWGNALIDSDANWTAVGGVRRNQGDDVKDAHCPIPGSLPVQLAVARGASTTAPEGTSDVTRAVAPTTASSPISTPRNTVARVAIHAPCWTRMGALSNSNVDECRS